MLAGRKGLLASNNDYDWLGHGIYFWEYSPRRAEEFALEKFRWLKRRAKVAVIGAIIDPGHCFNLLEASALEYLALGYEELLLGFGSKDALPKNGEGRESWKRHLDCAVINTVHQMRAETQKPTWIRKHPGRQPLQPYDCVRGAFWEGGPLYDGARIEKKNHIQICVRNPECIKGYFWPILD